MVHFIKIVSIQGLITKMFKICAFKQNIKSRRIAPWLGPPKGLHYMIHYQNSVLWVFTSKLSSLVHFSNGATLQ